MSTPLRLLLVEDSEDDALLLVRQIRSGGYEVHFERVDTAAALDNALKKPWDIVISDYAMPGFNGLSALMLLQKRSIDIPFIMVSGTIGEDIAVEAMKAGAHDYVMKTNLVRLIPAIGRELREIDERRQRKRAEEALRASEERFSKAFHASPTPMVIARLDDGVFVDVNDSFLTLLGYKQEEVIGRTYSAIGFIGDEDRENARRALLDGKTLRNHEVKLSTKSGDLRTVLLSMEVIEIAGVKCSLATAIDITERKRLEEQFRQAQKMEAFGQLAAGIAHDFNNIMTVVQGNLSLMRMESASRSEQASAADQITRAAQRATNLTRQLLMFSRRSPMQPKALDLNDVVSNMTKMLKHLIGEHIALEAHYAPSSAPIHADPGMMEQVLMNLAVNSRDAMPKGGKLIIETLPVSLDEQQASARPRSRPGAFICLSVRDTGCGIPPEHLSHIFEPFYTTKEVGKGTGLGLATVFGIVEQHHGWIDVESHVGIGTTMRIYFPCSLRSATSVAERQTIPKIRGGTETLLLVEDETPVRQLMGRLLSHHGYQVHAAASGVDALKIWEEHRPAINLLVTDMVMPDGINGRELADRMKSEKSDLKVIYVSGYTDEMLGPDSPLRNNPNFMEKPFDPYKFLQRVRDCLDAR